VIATQVDTTRRWCGLCRCYGWSRVSPRFGRRTPMWAARFVWWLSLKGRVGLLLAGPLTALLWKRICLSCAIIFPVRLLLENEFCDPWWGIPGKVRNAYIRPPEAARKAG
jgi:hypothetical protein